MQLSATQYIKHPASTISAEALAGWTPIEARSFGDQRFLNWANFGEIPFSDPFFFQTASRLRSQDSYEIFTTGFEALEAFQSPENSIEPNGFIFHVSHCGSTLLSNVLNGIPRNFSISEPEPINEIFIDEGSTLEQRAMWLRGLIHAYGQRRLGNEENFFVKFNSWAIGFFGLIRAAFPTTPWVCLYRNPVEIMAGQFSRQQLNTLWLLDERYSGLNREQRVQTGLVEILARTMGRYYSAIRDIATADPGGLCINYNQLSPATYARVCDHFNIHPNAHEFEQMCEQTKVHAKDFEKKKVFDGDTEKKRKEAYPSVYEMADTWSMEAYNKLEEIRLR